MTRAADSSPDSSSQAILGIDFINRMVLEHQVGIPSDTAAAGHAPYSFRLELDTPLSEGQAAVLHSLLHADERRAAAGLILFVRHTLNKRLHPAFVLSGLADPPGLSPDPADETRYYRIEDFGGGTAPGKLVDRKQTDAVTDHDHIGPVRGSGPVSASLIAWLTELADRLATSGENAVSDDLLASIDGELQSQPAPTPAGGSPAPVA